MPGPARTRRRLKQPREQVMAAAMTAIAERGLAELTIAGLGREVGMSSGHVMYYFGSKDELLLRTLEWSEAQLGAERRAALSTSTPAPEYVRAPPLRSRKGADPGPVIPPAPSPPPPCSPH